MRTQNSTPASMRPLPGRMTAVQSPIIPTVAEWIRRHPGTISLGQGVVSYGPPPRALERIPSFLSDPDNHKYKSVQGLPELLQILEYKLAGENRIPIGGGNAVMVTSGGNVGFMNAILAVTDPGDEILLQTPYYFNHEMAVTMAGCRPVLVPTDDQYQLRPDLIRKAVTDRTRAIVTISPNNPTGAVYPEGALREVNALCAERGIYHVHDEAYEYFLYDGAVQFSPGAIEGSAGHTISLYSLSKAYGFASWRIGYMVMPERLLESVKKIQDTIQICPPVISQHVAMGALEAGIDYCRDQLRGIAEARRIVQDELLGLTDLCTVPRAGGAFYFLLRMHRNLDPLKLTEQLIAEHRVAVIPGPTFGLTQGCYLRVAYGALREETAKEGIGRLVRGLRALAS